MHEITVRAFGKLNLYLDITGKREDGYHLLRSVMQSVSVYDTLRFSIGCGLEDIELICDEPSFPKDKNNLICKACERFYLASGIAPEGLRVYVDKKIPSMAGMAGGSADCGATLIALNTLYGKPLSEKMLFEIGAGLGADVPFTMLGGTVLCEGIGEKLTPYPTLKNVWFAAVRPDIRISTPEAYRSFDICESQIKRKSFPEFEHSLEGEDISGLSDGMFNALEAAVREPLIEQAKSELLQNGALGALMTGSGSVVFGVFASRKEAERCIEKMRSYSFSQVLEPVSAGCEIMG